MQFTKRDSDQAVRFKSSRCGPLRWAGLLIVVLASGCSTVDTGNTDYRPWDRPTRTDVSKDWLFQDFFRDRYDDPSRGSYP
jgi:hypothetical protein